MNKLTVALVILLAIAGSSVGKKHVEPVVATRTPTAVVVPTETPTIQPYTDGVIQLEEQAAQPTYTPPPLPTPAPYPAPTEAYP